MLNGIRKVVVYFFVVFSRSGNKLSIHSVVTLHRECNVFREIQTQMRKKQTFLKNLKVTFKSVTRIISCFRIFKDKGFCKQGSV